MSHLRLKTPDGKFLAFALRENFRRHDNTFNGGLPHFHGFVVGNEQNLVKRHGITLGTLESIYRDNIAG